MPPIIISPASSMPQVIGSGTVVTGATASDTLPPVRRCAGDVRGAVRGRGGWFAPEGAPTKAGGRGAARRGFNS